jgi:flagellar basal body-associated protein FliL
MYSRVPHVQSLYSKLKIEEKSETLLLLSIIVAIVAPLMGVMFWLIFRCPEMPSAQTRPLPVMAYEEPLQKPLLSQAWAFLRDKRSRIRWYHFPT